MEKNRPINSSLRHGSVADVCSPRAPACDVTAAKLTDIHPNFLTPTKVLTRQMCTQTPTCTAAEVAYSQLCLWDRTPTLSRTASAAEGLGRLQHANITRLAMGTSELSPLWTAGALTAVPSPHTAPGSEVRWEGGARGFQGFAARKKPLTVRSTQAISAGFSALWSDTGLSPLSHHVPPSVSSQMTHRKPHAMRTAWARASRLIPDKAAGGKSLRLRESYSAPSVERQEKKHLAAGTEVERKAAGSKTLLLTAGSEV